MRIQSIGSSRLLFAASLSALLLAGCDEINQMNENAAKRPAGAGTGLLPPLEDKVTGQPKATNPADTTNAATPGANAAPANENLQKAEDVVTQKKDYGGGVLMSPITTPISEYFSVRGGIPLMQIKHDMDIYKAIHNRFPKNKEEFTKEILEPANIELPELPPGAKYIYDAEKGELLVQTGGAQQ